MAKTLIPWSTTRAAATSSWVESGLLAQSTRSAPPAFRAMARLAVSAVTCRHAAIRIPFSGFCFANRSRIWCTTGIERPDHSMRPRPFSASARFFTSLGTGADGFFRDASFLAGTAMCRSTSLSRSSGQICTHGRGSKYARLARRASASPATGRVSTVGLLPAGGPAFANPRVVPPRLVPVAAGRHLAPAASSVLAGVEEQPPTPVRGRCLADTDAAPLGPGDQLRGRLRQAGDERIEASRLRRDPAVVVLGRPHQPALRPGAANLSLEDLERLGSRLDVPGNGEEHSEKRLAEGPDPDQRRARLGRPELDLHQHRMGPVGIQPARLEAPRDEVLRRDEVLARLGQPLAAHAVEEVQHRVPAGQREAMCAREKHALRLTLHSPLTGENHRIHLTTCQGQLDGYTRRSPMRLYWRPQTRASRVEWVLAELGEPVERVLAPESGTKERFQLHPLGRVPVLEDDAGVRRFESLALCSWLADRRPDRGLIPPAGSPERATHDQWLLFAATEVEPLLDLICLHTEELPEAERNPSVVPWAGERLRAPLRVLERAVEGR